MGRPCQSVGSTFHIAPTRDREGVVRTLLSHALSLRGRRSGWTVLSHGCNALRDIAADAAGETGDRRPSRFHAKALRPMPFGMPSFSQKHALDLRHQRSRLRRIAKAADAPLFSVGRVTMTFGSGRLCL